MTTCKDFLGTNPDNRGIPYIPIRFLINRGPRALMTQECIPILLIEFQKPQSFF